MKATKVATPTKETKRQKSLSTRPPVEAEEISERAYHIWLERGCTHGFDIEDWLQAEYELLNREILMNEQIVEYE